MVMFTPEKIRALRKALDLNTTEFATLLGKTANTIACWETGARHPAYKMMVKLNELAEKHGVDLSKALSKMR